MSFFNWDCLGILQTEIYRTLTCQRVLCCGLEYYFLCWHAPLRNKAFRDLERSLWYINCNFTLKLTSALKLKKWSRGKNLKDLTFIQRSRLWSIFVMVIRNMTSYFAFFRMGQKREAWLKSFSKEFQCLFLNHSQNLNQTVTQRSYLPKLFWIRKPQKI